MEIKFEQGNIYIAKVDRFCRYVWKGVIGTVSCIERLFMTKNVVLVWSYT